MWRITHREAVAGTVILSICDAWHYEVLWTCAWTRLLWYARDYVRSILYIMLHSTHLANAFHCTLPSSQDALKHTPEHALKCTPNCTRWHSQSTWLYAPKYAHKRPQAHSRVPSQILFQLNSMAHSQPAWLYAPKDTPNTLPSTPPSTFSSTLPSMLSRTLLIALDDTLPACLTVCSEVSSQYTLKHTPEHAPKYTLQRKDTPNLTDYILPCMLLGARSRDLLSGRRQEPWGRWRVASSVGWVACGIWQVAGRGWWPAEMLMSVDIIVRTFSLARPSRQDHTIPYSQGVDNCGLRFCRKGR